MNMLDKKVSIFKKLKNSTEIFLKVMLQQFMFLKAKSSLLRQEVKLIPHLMYGQ